MVIITVATPDDVEAASRNEPPGANVAAAHYARQQAGQATYLVAREGDRVLGHCLVVQAEVQHLHVQADARGRGVGTALIAAAEQQLRDAGHDHVLIGVEMDNAGALALYTRLGFRPTGESSTYSYEYVDSDGQRQHAVETSNELRKPLDI